MHAFLVILTISCALIYVFYYYNSSIFSYLKLLKEALNTIDKELYPERIRIIKEEIVKHERINKDKNDRMISGNISTKKDFTRLISNADKFSIILKIYSFFWGINYFISLIFGMGTLLFGYSIELYFPFFSKIPLEKKAIIYLIIVFAIHLGFISGSIGSFLNKKIFKYILMCTWGLMAVGLKLYFMKWWPTLNLDFPFSLTFLVTENEAIGFRINLLSAILFLWSGFLIPEVRKEIFKM